MQRFFTTILIAVSVSSLAPAQAPADTTLTLSEVTVQAQHTRLTPTSAVFTPTSRQKVAASSGTDLLRQMAVPQLRVSPSDDNATVTTLAGQPVELFINYMPATSQDMTSMRTTDVRRVEILDFPTDPRFRNNPHVVNFIVQEYLYGGYTKITQRAYFPEWISNTSAYSKLTYRRMTYDLYAGYDNMEPQRHDRTYRSSTYALRDEATGLPYTITRSETPLESSQKHESIPVTFRATYSTDKIQIRNTLGFHYRNTHTAGSSGLLTVSRDDSPVTAYGFSSSNPAEQTAASWNGNFYFVLPRQFALNLVSSLSYSHNINTSDYRSDLVPGGIYSKARENAFNTRQDLYLQKQFGNAHSVSFNGTFGLDKDRVQYIGTGGSLQKFTLMFWAAGLNYNYNTEKLSLYADAGVANERPRSSGIKYVDWYPYVHINASYAPSSRHRLSLWFQYASNTPGLEERTTNIMQQNEYLYITGNPHLHNSRHTTVNLSYSWIPSDRFTVSPYIQNYSLYNTTIIYYTPWLDGSALLRHTTNNGDYISTQAGIGFTAYLLGRSLTLSLQPYVDFKKHSGINRASHSPFFTSAQASYYLGQFNFMAYFNTKARGYDYTTNSYSTSFRPYYSIAAGWANSSWNVRLSFINFANFNRRDAWRRSTTVTTSPLYTDTSVAYGSDLHATVSIRAAYTFGYGKKIQRNNEIGSAASSSSAILR